MRKILDHFLDEEIMYVNRNFLYLGTLKSLLNFYDVAMKWMDVRRFQHQYLRDDDFVAQNLTNHIKFQLGHFIFFFLHIKVGESDQ